MAVNRVLSAAQLMPEDFDRLLERLQTVQSLLPVEMGGPGWRAHGVAMGQWIEAIRLASSAAHHGKVKRDETWIEMYEHVERIRLALSTLEEIAASGGSTSVH